MIEKGCFSDVDLAMMVHPCPFDSPDGVALVAITELTITYTGKAPHAAAFSWEGVNALDAAIAACNGMLMLRQQMKPTWRVHGIIKNGGAKPNIIPEKSELEYYIRAPTAKELKILETKAEAVFQAAGQATGCSVEIKDGDTYSNLINNTILLQLYTTNAEKLGVDFSDPITLTEGKPMASNDMGNVSYIVPSIHPNYSIGTRAVNHTIDFEKATNTDYAHERTLIAAKAMAMTAIDVLSNSEFFKSVKHAKDEPYNYNHQRKHNLSMESGC